MNPVPVTVKVDPPAAVTREVDDTEVTDGAIDKLAPVEFTEVKPAVVPPHCATTAREPAVNAGMTQLISLEFTKVVEVHAVPPTVNVQDGANPVPFTMTTLPPAVLAEEGATLATVGAT